MEVFGLVGDLAVGEAGEGGQFGDQGAASVDEDLAGEEEFGREGGEDGGVGLGFFKEGISGLEGSEVALEGGEVTGFGLSEEEVEEAASAAGWAFDEEEVFGTEDDGAEFAEEIRHLTDGLAIELDGFFAGGPIQFEFVADLGFEVGADEVTWGAVADHLGTADAAEGAEGGEEVEGFEDIGFALGVITDQEVEAGGEGEVQARVIAEVTESELGDMHGVREEGEGERRRGGGGVTVGGGASFRRRGLP